MTLDTSPGYGDATGIMAAQHAQKANLFGLVRLALAFAVLFSHCFALTHGSNEFEPLFVVTGWLSLGALAVDFFFAISGYLITQSWIRSTSAADFARRRLLRIYPAYWAAFVLSIVAGIVGADKHRFEYLEKLRARNEVLMRGVFFLDGWSLEGGPLNNAKVFMGNPIPHYINGSLWTLQPELRCYAIVMVFGIFGVFTRKNLPLVPFGAAYVCYAYQVVYMGNPEFSMWRLLAFFCAGMSIAKCDERIVRLSVPRAVISVWAIVVATPFPLVLQLILPFCGTVAILSIASAPSIRIGRCFARTDISYGAYLYSFPIQQIILHLFRIESPAELLIASLPLTFALAWISWHVIEQPLLDVAKRFKATPPLIPDASC